ALFLIFPFILAYPSTASETAELALLSPHADEVTPTPFPPILPTDTPAAIQATLAVLPTAAVSSSTPTSSPSPSPTPIVVDDGDEGFSATGGRWWLEEAGYEGDFRWAGTHASDPYAEVIWRPKIETCGFYEVKVHLPESYPTSRQARYQIAHREGIDAVVVDQSSQSGWITLGEYEIAPDGDTFLQLDNATGEPDEWDRIIVFDAAGWTFQSPCAADSEP
ncbi:MAG: hypothetical protein MUO58_16065, partial [Anaerolineales bacterium]|nr:hypothetical protein [Anaerolineales bacterium]